MQVNKIGEYWSEHLNLTDRLVGSQVKKRLPVKYIHDTFPYDLIQNVLDHFCILISAVIVIVVPRQAIGISTLTITQRTTRNYVRYNGGSGCSFSYALSS